MKLTISRKDLADLLARGASSAQRGSVIPVLAHCRLTAKARILRVSSTDLEMQAEALGGAEIEVEGETTVNAEKLKGFVDKLPNKTDLTVSLAIEGADLIAKAGRARGRFPTLPAADLPFLDRPNGLDAVTFSISGADLDRLLARTAPIAAIAPPDQFRSIFLHSRAWHGGEPALCAVATNRAVLIVTGVEHPAGADSLPENGPGGRGVLLSPTTALAVLRLFKGEESVRLTVDRVRAIFEGATTILTSKLVEGQYPDYMRIMSLDATSRVRLDRVAAVATVALLETFNADSNQGRRIEAASADNGLALATGGGGEGEGFAVTEAEVEGDVKPFGLSSAYLKMMLSAFKVETVTLSIRDPSSPLVFEADAEADTIGVVMPMRVSGRLASEGAAA